MGPDPEISSTSARCPYPRVSSAFKCAEKRPKVASALALLLLYFAPAWIFVRRLAGGVPQSARVAAAMGLCVCLGFFAFGLTELMFRGMRTMSFYALMIAWLMALSDTGYLKKTSPH